MKSLFILESQKIKNYKNEMCKPYKADKVSVKTHNKIEHYVKSI